MQLHVCQQRSCCTALGDVQIHIFEDPEDAPAFERILSIILNTPCTRVHTHLSNQFSIRYVCPRFQKSSTAVRARHLGNGEPGVLYENHTKSADKTLVYAEGATHGYPTCKKCEKTPGRHGDTVKTRYDYADGWLSKSGQFLQ